MMEQICHLEDEDAVTLCKEILAVTTIAYRPVHLTELFSIIDLPDRLSSDLESLKELVRLCGSFLIIRDDVINFVHQSAKDYLSTKADTQIFPTRRGGVHYRVLLRSLQAMSMALRRDVYGLRQHGILIREVGSIHPDPLTPVRYSCTSWVGHLCEMDGNPGRRRELCDGGMVHMFVQNHFLHWLEALSLMGNMSDGAVMLRDLESMLTVSNSTKL
jgi:hypothetical protein